jgi:CubicO group peptidase (beta-lactamase class C family)
MLQILAMVLSVGFTSPVNGDDAIQPFELVANLIDRCAWPDGPGIQYIIVDKDKVLFEHSSGLADIKNHTLLSMNHTMAAFSMTQIITAIATLQRVEKQKLNMDGTVDRYIKHPYSPDITIRQLLNHTSGIPNPIPIEMGTSGRQQRPIPGGCSTELGFKRESEVC